MADLLFKCPGCLRHLVVDACASGKVLNCVTCRLPIQVPAASVACACPACASEFLAPADVEGELFHCTNCGGELIVPVAPTTRLAPRQHGSWNSTAGADTPEYPPAQV